MSNFYQVKFWIMKSRLYLLINNVLNIFKKSNQIDDLFWIAIVNVNKGFIFYFFIIIVRNYLILDNKIFILIFLCFDNKILDTNYCK